jgi:hypothetical protein
MLIGGPLFAATFNGVSIPPCLVYQASQPREPHNMLVRGDLLAAPLLARVWEQPDDLSHTDKGVRLGSEQTCSLATKSERDAERSTVTSAHEARGGEPSADCWCAMLRMREQVDSQSSPGC